MAHRSRLAGFIIDCQTDDLDGAAAFWSGALGIAVTDRDSGGTGRYAEFEPGPGALHIEVQKVAHASRVHLDIETDDIAAEVARLAALGAKVVQELPRWTVMEAPTGQRFCVVRMKHPERGAAPNRWP
jgi:predicted enzyme related to lactoylglutathione lyase